MASTIKFLDPVQGLIDYVNDIKPYHSKIIESLVEYVGQESVEITLIEDFKFDICMLYSLTLSTCTEPYVFNPFVGSCGNGGYDTLGFDDPDNISVLSPDPSKTIPEFPAFTSNSFIVLGDRRQSLDPNSNLTLKLISFIEDRIIAVNESSTGSPVIGGSFSVLGDRSLSFSIGDIFSVTGSYDNNTSYKITGITVDGSPTITTLEVDNQLIKSNNVGGFIKTTDTNNTGVFSVISSIFTQATSTSHSYTTVFISGLILTPPSESSIDSNQRYVSLVSIGGIEYKKILSYSNVLKYYSSSPIELLQTPNEGVFYAPIVNLSQSSPSYFVVDGNFENSNIFVGDEITVVNSTDNNTSHIIQSISVITTTDGYETTFGVTSIHDSTADGFIKLDIPSNVFVVDGDYTDFFKQGTRLTAITGSKNGNYTTLYSKFVNNETHIRVQEDLIHGRGRLIAGTVTSPTDGILVDGNLTVIYKQGTQLNIINSLRNDGAYTVSDNSTYNLASNTTTIPIVEPFDVSDSTGETHEFVKGTLTYRSTGFGQTPELCEVVPETLVSVGIQDRLYIDGIGIWTYDNIIAHGINDIDWGYDLPKTTIFSTTQPADPTISITVPGSPIENDLWFDTSLNTGSPSAPGTLKQYIKIVGSPTTFDWIDVPNNKTYWIDTSTNYMYYRMIYQYYDNIGSPVGYPIPTLANNLDTGWILEYTKVPGYNDQLVGNSTREQQGFETFFAVESSTSVAQTTFTLDTLLIPLTLGSPSLPNPEMLEVYVNNAIADVNVLSTTSFDIVSPRLRVGDLVEARVFDDTAIASNSWVGSFDTNAAIVETFDMLLGYRFNIEGTESSSKTIHIPDTANVYNIFMQGSPPTLVDNVIEISGSAGSPNNDGIYTISAVSQEGSPINHVVLTVIEPLLDTGIFSGSPIIDSGKALYQQWFQYLIVNTTANTILVLDDATNDIQDGNSIKISHSVSNNGTYTVSGTPTYDGRNTIITTVETITDLGNSGGWVESI